MRFLLLRAVPLVAASAALAGCDADGLADRTYPGAGDFPAVPVFALDGAGPGRYNVEAEVRGVDVCPPEADCLYAAWITLGAIVPAGVTPPPEPPGPIVSVETPEQFGVGRGGRFLVVVDDPPPGEDLSGRLPRARAVRLLGYDWL